VPDVPALVVPVAQPRPDPPAPGVSATGAVRFFEQRTADVLLSLDLDRNFLVLELDREYLQTTMLASVADRHFGDPAGSRYRIAVINQAGRSPRPGSTAGGSIEESAADVSTQFFRVGSIWRARRPAPCCPGKARRRLSRGAGQPAGGACRPRAPFPSSSAARRGRRTEVRSLMADAGWRLLVQHAAGSLDAAVAEARRRNLWLSFGILSVLVASVGLIVLNARRSERLAAQQMDFVATVSHELRTPLAVIRSAAQNLAAGVVHIANRRAATVISSRPEEYAGSPTWSSRCSCGTQRQPRVTARRAGCAGRPRPRRPGALCLAGGRPGVRAEVNRATCRSSPPMGTACSARSTTW
jgi:hypothetical protein